MNYIVILTKTNQSFSSQIGGTNGVNFVFEVPKYTIIPEEKQGLSYISLNDAKTEFGELFDEDYYNQYLVNFPNAKIVKTIFNDSFVNFLSKESANDNWLLSSDVVFNGTNLINKATGQNKNTKGGYFKFVLKNEIEIENNTQVVVRYIFT